MNEETEQQTRPTSINLSVALRTKAEIIRLREAKTSVGSVHLSDVLRRALEVGLDALHDEQPKQRPDGILLTLTPAFRDILEEVAAYYAEHVDDGDSLADVMSHLILAGRTALGEIHPGLGPLETNDG